MTYHTFAYSNQKVAGRRATNVERDFVTRWGNGNFKPGSKSCLMYGRRTSAVFSISTTRRIYQGQTFNIQIMPTNERGEHTWIERKRAQCLAAISWYMLLTASALVRSRNSLYMLWVPERESYRSQIPKFFTFRGFFSWIWDMRSQSKAKRELRMMKWPDGKATTKKN